MRNWSSPATEENKYKGLRIFASEALAGEPIRIEPLEQTALIFYRNTPIREVSLVTGVSVPFHPSPKQ